MSIKSVLSAGAVILLLGAVSSAYGQGDQRPAQQQDKAAPTQGGQSTRGLQSPSQGQHVPEAAPTQGGQSTRGLQSPSQGQHVPEAAPTQGGQSTRGLKPSQGQTPQAAPTQGGQSTRGLQPEGQSQHGPQPTARPAPTSQRNQPAYGGAYHGGVRPTAEPTYGGVHPSGVPQHQGQVRTGFLQSRAGSWTTDHRDWKQRGGYSGYRVPDDRFKLYFGTGHFFHIGSLPLLFVGGYPRFQYDGYWVTLMDPWPESWPPLWYESDDVYVDWGGDGYYLYDRNYPGIALAVMISF